MKAAWGVDGVATPVSNSNPLPVSDGGSTVSVDDGGGSVTVDGSVTVSSAPAAGRSTDSISAAAATDAVMNGNTPLTPKFIKISASSSGANTVVAAVSSKKIRVLRWSLVCNGAVNVKWQSSTIPTDLTGLYYFAANGGVSQPYCEVGHFETISGEALSINLSGNVAVGGDITYIEV